MRYNFIPQFFSSFQGGIESTFLRTVAPCLKSLNFHLTLRISYSLTCAVFTSHLEEVRPISPIHLSFLPSIRTRKHLLNPTVQSQTRLTLRSIQYISGKLPFFRRVLSKFENCAKYGLIFWFYACMQQARQQVAIFLDIGRRGIF